MPFIEALFGQTRRLICFCFPLGILVKAFGKVVGRCWTLLTRIERRIGVCKAFVEISVNIETLEL